MIDRIFHIAILDPSEIICEGVINILSKHNHRYRFYRVGDLEELNKSLLLKNLDLAILNPVQIQNRSRLLKSLRKEYPQIKWIGLVYSLFDNEILAQFDDILPVAGSSGSICRLVGKHTSDEVPADREEPQEQLTEREIEVLQLLLKGSSNKEIASNLNISIHTVISHRKNITQKTGIKSQAGLTLYALSNKIISVDR